MQNTENIKQLPNFNHVYSKRFSNLFSQNENMHHAIHIYSTKEIVLNNEFTKEQFINVISTMIEGDLLAGVYNFTGYHIFAKQYDNNSDTYNQNISRVFSDLLELKGIVNNINEIQHIDSLWEQSYSSRNEEDFSNFVNTMDDHKNNIICIDLRFCLQSFCTKIVIPYPKKDHTNSDILNINDIPDFITMDTNNYEDYKETKEEPINEPYINQQTKEMQSNNYSIYVLKLQSGKYYIGKTKDTIKRINDHIDTYGSGWTKKYKPIELYELIPNCDPFDEDKHTLKYMEKYGISNVRGGSFCEIQLSEANIVTLKKMLNGSSDKCYNCGTLGHFINNCPNNKKVEVTNYDSDEEVIVTHGYGYNEETYDYTDEEEESEWYCTYCEKGFRTKNGATYHENFYCKQKPKKNKKVNNTNQLYVCPQCDKEFKTQKGAQIHIDRYCKGNVYICQQCDREFKTEKGVQTHIDIYCKVKVNKIKKVSGRTYNKCNKCGRSGHLYADCYASTHIKGYVINY
jgi:hypothetical protein